MLKAIVPVHPMKGHWGSGAGLHSLLTLALDEGEQSAPQPAHATSKERVPSNH